MPDTSSALITTCPFTSHRPFLYLMHTQYSALRNIDDRCTHQRTKYTTIGNGKCSALSILPWSVYCPLLCRPVQLLSFQYPPCSGFPHCGYRNGQSSWCANCNTDISIIMIDELVAINISIHRWPFRQCHCTGFCKKTHEPKSYPMYFFEFIFILCCVCP